MPQDKNQIILVASDDSAFCARTTDTLRESGFETHEINEFSSGLEFVKTMFPALIIVAVRESEDFGAKFCRQIKIETDFSLILQISPETLINVDGTSKIRGCQPDAVFVEPDNQRNLLANVRNLLRFQQSQNELRLRDERHRALLAATGQVVWTTPSGHDQESSKWWSDLTGQTLEETLGWGWLKHLHPDDRDRVQVEWQQASNTMTPYEIGYRVKSVTDDYHNLLVRGYPIFNPDKSFREWIGTITDITAQKQIEYALLQQNTLLELSHEPVLVWTFDKGIISWNQGCAQLYGYPKDEAFGQISHELLQTIFPVSFADMYHTLETIGQWSGELSHLTKDGSRVIVESRCVLTTDDVGRQLVMESHRDITKRRQAEESYRAFIEQSSEGIWRAELEKPITTDLPTDEQIKLAYDYGYVAEANDAMAQMYGFESAQNLIGARLADLFIESDPANDKFLRAFIESNYRLTEAESHEKSMDGRELYFLNNLVGIVKDGKLIRAWGMQRDITERKQAEREREELIGQAQAAQVAAELANRAKDEFLAVLSHELRTPLNAMYGWARMLASGTLDEATQKRAVEVIERNIQLQSKLIEDILDVSRIVSGKIKIEMRRLDLCPLIHQLAETSRPNAALKQITIETECPDGSLIVMVDAERLQQVLSNLINNAFKFTPTGGNLRIALEEIDDKARISVTDSGIGIESEFLPHVFDRFKQADSSSKRHHGGLGLGLAIVKHLVEMHGGSVSALSDGKDQGATFIVEFPLVESPQTKSETNDHVAQTNGIIRDNLFEKMNILVIEDDADAADVLRVILAAHGAQITHYSRAREALTALKTNNFDLILSDIGLPEMDGVEFIKMVRQASDAQIKNLPALAVTAYASKEDTERFLEAGFDACLAKPINFNALQSAVATLKQPRQEKQIPE